ncbi:MAG: PilW family protein, partial [Methylococcales bacterium]
RLSGYIGCSSITATNPVVIANNPLVAPIAHAGNADVVAASSITGGNGGDDGSFTSPNPALSSSPLGEDDFLIANTDALTVQFAESCGGFTTADMNTVNPTGVISANNTCGTISLGTGATAATLGSPLLISDCATAHIFRASTGTTQNSNAAGTATASLGKTYAAGSEIMLFRSYTYFIRENPAGRRALYRVNNNDLLGAQELVEGIDDMQVLYGVDNDAPADGIANYYVSADNLTLANWPQVVAVRISVLVSTLDDGLTSESLSYFYNGASHDAPDHRIRRVFTSTVDLRNR